MFTCIFALARTVGWMTQWEEMITDPEYKIGRPRQLYTGRPARRQGAGSALILFSAARRTGASSRTSRFVYPGAPPIFFQKYIKAR
jgi:hypothetical protein